jgi:PAS domain S-box-containing protein
MDILFNQQQADSLFPFHLKLNTNGVIVDCGKSIRKLCPNALNNLFIHQFSIENFTGELIIDFLLQHLQEKITIETKGNQNTHLSGQFVFIEQNQLIIFMGSPSFSSIKELEENAFGENNFSVQNAQIDLIQAHILKKEIEEARRDKYEQTLLFALEKMGDNVWMHDYKKEVTTFSHNKRAFIELEDSSSSISEQWWKAVHPDDISKLVKQDQQYRNKIIDHHHTEYRIKDKFGNYKWILDRGIITDKDEDGYPIKILGTHMDITKIKETEAEFNKQRSFYESILNSIPTDIAVFDASHRYLFVNPIGIKNDKLRNWIIGKTDEEYCTYRNKDPKIAEDRREIFNQVISSKKQLSWEETLNLPDGKTEYHLRNLFPVLNDKAEIELVIGFGLNISERKQIEDKVLLNEKRYRDLFNYSQALICTHDLEGKILSVNPAICNIMGYSSEELIGRNIKEFVPKDKMINFDEQYLQNVLNTGTAEGVFIIICKNGDQIYLLYQNYMVEETSSAPYIIGFSQDITNRIKAERELLKAKEETERASRVKEVFLANISHEIRTPMNGILGIGGLLYKTNLNPKQEEYTKLILESADNLLHIVNDVLDFTKIESGKIELEHIPFLLDEKISNTLKTFIFKIEEKGLELVFDNQVSPEIVLLGDPFRLGQILNNLISNALKFTETGKITISATQVNEKNKTPLFEFKVSDTGIGISEENLSNIFNEFVQASSETSRKYGGTGLGLTITKNLIEMQGGSIKAESILNKGTSFIVRIPYQIGEKSMLNSGKEEVVFTPIDKKRILVAEDVTINQIIVKQILEEWGHEVVLVANGKEAYEAHKKKDFDLILMDIHMPEVDGYEATQMIRHMGDTIKAAVPIVALTANAFKKETDRFADAGFNDYITKPFTEAGLYDCIKKQLQLNSVVDFTKKIKKKISEENIEKLYDLSALQGIEQDDTVFLKEIVLVFIKNTSVDITNLLKAIDGNHTKDIFQLAHRMKSSIYSLGIKQAYKTVESIEFYAKTGEQLDKIPQLGSQLNETIQSVFEQLKNDFKL